MKTNRFACISRCGAFLAAVAAVTALAGSARAETYSQIPPGFSASSVELYFGFPFAYSQNDVSPDVGAGDVSNYATIYDNFSFGSNLSVTNFSWIGMYDADPTGSIFANSFTISIYDDAGSTPGALLESFNVGNANETSIDSTIYSYSADITPFEVTAGQQYWFSAVANMNADVPVNPGDPDFNQWGVAFSAIGDGVSVQDFQTAPNTITRFDDTIDYAFSVTAVPEPATGLALLIFGGGAAAYRRVRRRPATPATEVAV
jgi:hypothetical protein